MNCFQWRLQKLFLGGNGVNIGIFNTELPKIHMNLSYLFNVFLDYPVQIAVESKKLYFTFSREFLHLSLLLKFYDYLISPRVQVPPLLSR